MANYKQLDGKRTDDRLVGWFSELGNSDTGGCSPGGSGDCPDARKLGNADRVADIGRKTGSQTLEGGGGSQPDQGNPSSERAPIWETLNNILGPHMTACHSVRPL